MTDHTNINNIPTTADTQAGYHALINCVILKSIDDLGYDALNDEGTLDWLGLTNITTEVLHHAIQAMPLKDDGTPNARPAMRRIMESLDAREETEEMVEMEIQFDSPELDTVSEPTEAELLEIDFDEVLENVIWNLDDKLDDFPKKTA